jgi:hypothetical protein
MSKKAPRHMQEYTPAEMKLMRQLARQRVSARVTALRLGRSPGAVRYKAMVEGISFRSINRKPRRR